MADRARGVISRFDGEVEVPDGRGDELIIVRLALGNGGLVDGVVEMPAGKGRFQSRLAVEDVDDAVKGFVLLASTSGGFEVKVTDGRTEEAKVSPAPVGD